MKNKKRIKTVIICVFLFFVLLDFVPVKHAIKVSTNEEVFIHSPKCKPHTQWVVDLYGNGRISEYIGCIVAGNTPDKWLAARDFDCRILFNMDGDKVNRFVLHYDRKKPRIDAKQEELQYSIQVTDWDIVYPIYRISFRRYTAPKGYLTVYDYDWIAVIQSWMKGRTD